jgi:dienelactone hydrolase
MRVTELEGSEYNFRRSQMELRGQTFPVFKGGAGPGVVLIHEVPGITEDVAKLGGFLVEKQFTVWMPYLFATDPGPNDRIDALGPTLRCVLGQMVAFSTNKTSPLTDWLRALAHELHKEVGGPGVGVIGMCFSGGYALATVLESSVVAPIMSQPALPVPIGWTRSRAVPGVSPSDAITVGRRINKENLCVLGLRFERDRWVRRARFERLKKMLGDNFEARVIPSPYRRAHSVLTRERDKHPDNPEIQAAVARVLQFLNDRLRTHGGATGAGSSVAP